MYDLPEGVTVDRWYDMREVDNKLSYMLTRIRDDRGVNAHGGDQWCIPVRVPIADYPELCDAAVCEAWNKYESKRQEPTHA